MSTFKISIPEMQAEIARLKAENERLREAAKALSVFWTRPCADGKGTIDDWPDEEAFTIVLSVFGEEEGEPVVTAGQLRRLRAALSALRSGGAAPAIALRPEVRAFAVAMEERLRANDHKGGWKDCSLEWLSHRLLEEWRELDGALWPEKTRDTVEVLHEAADVANFAMMVADVCASLLPPAPAKEGD